jgi:hypothetical protein
MTLIQVKRIRWAVRLVLVLGVAASVAGNILHANDNPISEAIAAWPPLALLLTVELISRVPVHRRGLTVARWAATAVIAGIAAWVSYWHMAAVAARYGETGASPYLLPLSVDGLVVVASVSLVELAGRIAAISKPATVPAPEPAAEPTPAPVEPVTPYTPEAAPEPVAEPVTEPAPADAPQGTRSAGRARSKSLTSAAKVARVAAKMPGATPAKVAAKVGVSESTARRYMPPAKPDSLPSPSGPLPAETQPEPAVNGRHVDLVEVTR